MDISKLRRFHDDRFVGLAAVRLHGTAKEDILDLTGQTAAPRFTFTAPQGQWRIYALSLTRNCGPHRNYINMMNKASCKVLLDTVYEAHWQHYGNLFGKTIAGFFSDEPEIGNGHLYEFGKRFWEVEDQAWSEEVEQAMKAKLGEDFVRLLPLLWEQEFDPPSQTRSGSIWDWATSIPPVPPASTDIFDSGKRKRRFCKMNQIPFQDGWEVKPGIAGPFDLLSGQVTPGKAVTLPHDGMIEEPRDPNAVSGTQYGFYPAKSCTYTKKFFAPESYGQGRTLLEIEGVQQRSMVYLNGEFVASGLDGYTGFYADLSPYLRIGGENILKVLAIGEELASRWYPGVGIYRDMWLWQGGEVTFLPDRQRVSTVAIQGNYAVLRLEGMIRNDTNANQSLTLCAKILNKEGICVADTTLRIPVLAREEGEYRTQVTVENPLLWSDKMPDLYRCQLALYDGDQCLDRHETVFGVRTLTLDARQGLCVNGVPTKLRGACVHHDNGIIGAVSLYDGELHRMRLLKEAGFNAIRSAHNPAGKALLRACDELGIYVMDELTDMWNEPKNAHDGALSFESNWKKLVESLVNKDFNHPSVLLYSLGNELPEIGRISGAVQARRLSETLRHLDPTRYTTFGLNGFLAAADDLPLFASPLLRVGIVLLAVFPIVVDQGGIVLLNIQIGSVRATAL